MRTIVTGCILGVLLAGCSAGGSGNHHTGAGGNGAGGGFVSSGSGMGGDINLTDGGSGTGGSVGGDTVVTPTCSMNCKDFPMAPIVDGNVPANPGTLFGAPDNFNPGLCIVE